MTATHDCGGVIAKNTKVLELPCCDTGRNSVTAKSLFQSLKKPVFMRVYSKFFTI